MFYTNNKSFYPTPASVIDRMLAGINLDMYESILEPSAGNGAIVKALLDRLFRDRYLSKECRGQICRRIDCIEKDESLRPALIDTGCPVISDDFLSFRTFKRYDLIVMNPPFENGDEHLLKAISLVEPYGGTVVCLLNSETLANPYTMRRKGLKKLLEKYDAEITELGAAFVLSERPTDVNVTMIKVTVPGATDSYSLLKGLAEADEEEDTYVAGCTELQNGAFISSLVAQYKEEARMGLALIDMGREFGSKCLTLIPDETAQNKFFSKDPLLVVRFGKYGEEKNAVTPNKFLAALRFKYWKYLFERDSLFQQGTQNLIRDIRSCVDRMDAFEFNEANILMMYQSMQARLISSVEDAILETFDKLSGKHAYSDQLENSNVHLYNGWKTNKAWIVNRKVVLPCNAFDEYRYGGKTTWRFYPTRYGVQEQLQDIERCLNYIDGHVSDEIDMHSAFVAAQAEEQTKDIQLKFFNVTFYKKGTCHIEFRDLDLLKKFNIYASQRRGWLPPSYGKCSYTDMALEEQEVIDGFEGKTEYARTLEKKDYFITKNVHLPALAGAMEEAC